MATRDEVYNALTKEREYQDKRWNATTTTTAGQHSVAEFVLFMDTYIQDTKQTLSKHGEPEASKLALDNLRKITAMGVACMEQNGIVERL